MKLGSSYHGKNVDVYMHIFISDVTFSPEFIVAGCESNVENKSDLIIDWEYVPSVKKLHRFANIVLLKRKRSFCLIGSVNMIF